MFIKTLMHIGDGKTTSVCLCVCVCPVPHAFSSSLDTETLSEEAFPNELSQSPPTSNSLTDSNDTNSDTFDLTANLMDTNTLTALLDKEDSQPISAPVNLSSSTTLPEIREETLTFGGETIGDLFSGMYSTEVRRRASVFSDWLYSCCLYTQTDLTRYRLFSIFPALTEGRHHHRPSTSRR